MDILSVREYRNNLASSFDRASEGERVIIRRKNNLYALVSIGNENINLSEKKELELNALTESIKRSLMQIKQIQEGKIPSKSAMTFIDEL